MSETPANPAQQSPLGSPVGKGNCCATHPNGVGSMAGLESLVNLVVAEDEFKTESTVETFPDEFSALEAANIGQEQTPIALKSATLVDNAKDLKFSCKANAAPIQTAVLNIGRTVQVNWVNGMSIEVDGRPYDLLQFHFHWPSEHVVDGKRHLVEMHLVFNDRDDTLTRDANHARLAVVGVFFDLGSENAFIEQFLSAIPENAGEEGSCNMQPCELSNLTLGSAWNYSGSLTTPPFSEGVTWIVSSNVMTMSCCQFDQLVKRNMRATNNRSLFKRNDREVVGCGLECCC